MNLFLRPLSSPSPKASRWQRYLRIALAVLAVSAQARTVSAGYSWYDATPADPTVAKKTTLWDSIPGSPVTWSVVTVLDRSGTFRVLAGRVDRGGLNIFFGRLREVLDPFAALLSPQSLLDGSLAFSPNHYCDVQVGVGYGCSPGAPLTGGGRFVPLRSVDFAGPGDTYSGVHRLTSERGGPPSLLALEFTRFADGTHVPVAAQFLADRTWKAWSGELERPSILVHSLNLRPARRSKRVPLLHNPIAALTDLRSPLFELEPICALPLSHPGAFQCVDRQGVPGDRGSAARIR